VIYEGKKTSIEEIYRGIDVVAVPSNIPDPLPRSAMEAMSLGLPVIGWPAGGIPDMVRERQTGWLVDDAEKFVAAIEIVLANPTLYERMSKICITVAREEFSLQTLHDKIDRIYRDL
jgi:glycosyltransferase involved in cell wall biosynthesis